MRQAFAVETVYRLVRRFRTRLLVCAAVSGAIWGTLAALLALAVGVYLFRVGSVSWMALPVFALAPVVGGAVIATVARRGSCDALINARLLDRRAGALDLFASSVDFVQRELPGDFVGAVIAQAGGSAGELNVSEVSPLRHPFTAWWYLPAAALLGAAMIVPLPAQEQPTSTEGGAADTIAAEIVAEETGLQEEGRRVIQELRESRDPVDRRTAEELEELWEKLEAGEATRSDLIEEVGKLADERLFSAPERLENLLKELRDVAEAFSEEEEWQEEKEELSEGGTRKLAERLRQEAQDVGEGAWEGSDKEQLSRVLKRAGERAGGAAKQLGKLLDDAGESLDFENSERARGQMDAAAGELDRIREELDKLRRLARSMEHLQELKRLARSTPGEQRQGEEGGSDEEKGPSGQGELQMAIASDDEQGSPGRGHESAGSEEQPDERSGSGQGAGSASEGPGIGTATDALPAQVPTRVMGQLTDEGEIASMMRESARHTGRSGAEYRDVIESALSSIEGVLSEEKIPLGRRALVREYFERLLRATSARAEQDI